MLLSTLLRATALVAAVGFPLVAQQSTPPATTPARGGGNSAQTESPIRIVSDSTITRRGQQVTVIAASGPVEIRAQGLALNDAAETERVRVQNVSSLKVVEGVVESDSVVRVGL